MSTEYDEIRKKIISTETPSSTKREVEELTAGPYEPLRKEVVEDGFLASWKEKERFFREYTPVKLNELWAEITLITISHGIEDQKYLKALEDLILNYRNRKHT